MSAHFWKRKKRKKEVIPPGIEPGTLSVLDSRDNRYTTESQLQFKCYLDVFQCKTATNYQLIQSNEGGKSVTFVSSCATSGGYFMPVILMYPFFITPGCLILDSCACSIILFSGCSFAVTLLTISGCLASHCCSNSCPVSLWSLLSCEELVHVDTTVTFTLITHTCIHNNNTYYHCTLL